MTADDLAALAPRLLHVTTSGAEATIRRHGLRCARSLLVASTLTQAEQDVLRSRRRAAEVPLALRDGTSAVLNDHLPLSEGALAACLDDGWSPAQWLRWLAEHVYFWPDEERLTSLLAARMNRGREREVLVFDTASLAGTHVARTALSPINSGATLRKPARRGASTYTPIERCSFREWQRLRNPQRRDRIAEVVVRGDVSDANRHLVEVRRYRGPERID